MKNLIYLTAITLLFSLTACNKKAKEVKETANVVEAVQTTKTNLSDGYNLMKQNCFVCHMEKPDPSKRGQMIAPPMLRVQEHYKPSYPNKKEFVNAIITWVKNPSEDKVMMPGAVRKFNLMPKIEIKDADLKLIAETLYDIDFGNMPKMHQNNNTNKLQLNNGKKWKLNETSKQVIQKIQKELKDFKSDDLSNYNQLGKNIFNDAKKILLDKSYDQKTFAQIQKFFHNVEGNMHGLIAAKTIEDAKTEQQKLIKKFNQFNTYFE